MRATSSSSIHRSCLSNGHGWHADRTKYEAAHVQPHVPSKMHLFSYTRNNCILGGLLGRVMPAGGRNGLPWVRPFSVEHDPLDRRRVGLAADHRWSLAEGGVRVLEPVAR
jgi:hypothetical protein